MALIEEINKKVSKLPPDKQATILDFISFIEQRQQILAKTKPIAERTRRMKKTLKNLAKMRVFADITDPVEWQKTIRKDRLLPGRE